MRLSIVLAAAVAAVLVAVRHGHDGFDTDGDAAFERRLEVVAAKGRVYARIKDARTAKTVGAAAVSRPNARTVKVAFRRSLLGRDVGAYRWFAIAGATARRTRR